jgi:DNA-binding NarL/FixJ family response regulator
MTTRIFIADDHQLFGEGLKELLLKQADFEVYGPFKESEVITYSIANLRPHVLLLDINLGKTDGLELGKELKAAYPDVKIIILTMYENEKMLARSKEYGMDGYLLKDCETQVLLGGIREVLAGGQYFITFKSSPVKSLTDNDRFLVDYHLSERELEVMEQVKLGLSNQQIADNLSLSYHTVKTHRKNIYLKLGVSNVAELIEFTAKFPSR